MSARFAIAISFLMLTSLSGCGDKKSNNFDPSDPDVTEGVDQDGDATDVDDPDSTPDGVGDGSDGDEDAEVEEPLGEYGEPCFVDEQCEDERCATLLVSVSGFCDDVENPGGESCGFCSKLCDNNADCGGVPIEVGDVSCQASNEGGAIVDQCLPLPDPSCVSCANQDGTPNDGACNPSFGNQCVSLIDGYFCAASCADVGDSACNEGFSCVSEWDVDGDGTMESGLALCIPDEQLCGDCYDPDGDGYGVGPGCDFEGVDCNNLNPVDDPDAPLINPGAPERCDGTDWNCNDDPLDGYDTSTDPNNCGGCGITCGAAQAVNVCVDSTCEIGECEENYYDLNNDYDDGCEYFCSPVEDPNFIDVPDLLGVDTNCDGIDGDISRAVFVSALLGSNDSNPGTRDRPVRNIWKAIEIAQENGLTQILVTGGTFLGPPAAGGTGTLNLAEGISIYGGYDQSSWAARNPGNFVTVIESDASVAVRAENLTAPTTVQGVTIRGASFTEPTGRSSYALWIAGSADHLTLEGSIVRAGAGGTGLPGAERTGIGNAGAAGSNGNPGGNANGTSGGGAGTSPCGANGGAGGNGRSDKDGEAGGNGSAGGDPISGGAGGGGGKANVGDWQSDEGKPGSAGSKGNNGANGGSGTATEQPTGVADATGWAGAFGGQGTRGRNGTGGGGGGAGGGDDDALGTSASGGGAGGGGGGGCGGQGGAGGGPGGASIGIYVIDSAPNLINIEIIRGIGGKGGVGQTGGNGGAGNGGGGGQAEDQGTWASGGEPGTGAAGASGGDGGAGGGGAGGCGGLSAGVVAVGTSTIDDGMLMVSGGSGGQGGNGGAGGRTGGDGLQAPSGNRGCNGSVEDILSY